MNPRLRVLEVSATRGDGLAAWYDWLRERLAAAARLGSVGGVAGDDGLAEADPAVVARHLPVA